MAEIVRDVFGNDKSALGNLLNKALSEYRNIPYNEIIPIWKVGYENFILTEIENDSYLADDKHKFIRNVSFKSRKISEKLKIKAENYWFLKKQNDQAIDLERKFFDLWVVSLVPEHGYEFYWFALNAKNNTFGMNLDERITNIDQLIRNNRCLCIIFDKEDFEEDEKVWRFWKTLFHPLGSLFEIYESYRYSREVGVREEIWIRQTEAIDILNNHQEFVEWVIIGILEYCREYWDWLDPIMLGLQEEIVIKILENYLEKSHSHEKYYHARRLLSHASKKTPPRGLMGLKYKDGLLEAVEDLYEFSNSSIRREKVQTWIGDAAVESLTFGAIGKANAEFNKYYDSQFGQDEHEHIAVLIEALHKSFVRLSNVVNSWIKEKYTFPAVFQTSIKRFPKRSPDGIPQEGGKKGFQADLAVILKCDIPELMLSERITFFQAKKISQIANAKTWEKSIPIDQSQLERAVRISEHFYYLFFLHSEIGKSPIVLPAQMIKDICKAQHIKQIPVPLILRSAKEFPTFLLFELIGLWIGDTTQDIISEVKKGCEVGQGPRVLLEVHISRKDNGEQ